MLLTADGRGKTVKEVALEVLLKRATNRAYTHGAHDTQEAHE